MAPCQARLKSWCCNERELPRLRQELCAGRAITSMRATCQADRARCCCSSQRSSRCSSRQSRSSRRSSQREGDAHSSHDGVAAEEPGEGTHDASRIYAQEARRGEGRHRARLSADIIDVEEAARIREAAFVFWAVTPARRLPAHISLEAPLSRPHHHAAAAP